MVVAIPARDEADSVRQCIRSVDQAAAQVPLPVLAVVAADSCGDDTFDVARNSPTEFCELAVIEGAWGRAGAARAAAVHHALFNLRAGCGPVWIANTDADCIVPTSWLRTQLELATEFDAVAGIVELDPLSTPPEMFDAFTASYRLDGDDHSHVHGANIGICASAYLDVGGWCAQTEVGEDHVIWHALRGVGRRARQTTTLRVLTSARTCGRVVGGFASDLGKINAASRPALAAHV